MRLYKEMFAIKKRCKSIRKMLHLNFMRGLILLTLRSMTKTNQAQKLMTLCNGLIFCNN